jgi:signal transduction histidine kinase
MIDLPGGPLARLRTRDAPMIRTFRFRITAWYVGLFAVLFAGFSLFVYGFLSRALAARVDETLASEVNTAAKMLPDEIEELGDAAKAADEVVSELQFRRGTIAIFFGDQLLASNGSLPKSPRARSARRKVVARGETFDILAVEPPDGIDADLLIVRNVILVALPLFLGLAGVGGYFTAKRNLKALELMAEQAHRITSSSLHTRLDPGRTGEELAVVAASFNELLSRLDQSFETMRRFVADASHELRTPLAVIRGEADVALGKERGAAEYRDSLAVILDESRRLSRMVDDLMNLARADAGHVTLRRNDFYFNDLLIDCCRSVQGLATGKGVTLECRPAADLPFTGDEELLRRLVINLLDNAIRYTPAGGSVTVELRSEPAGVRLRIADTGVGISAEAAPHVFERFFRADKARTRGGFGLGLSIVKWIAESHGGTVEMESGPTRGSTFTVKLPR